MNTFQNTLLIKSKNLMLLFKLQSELISIFLIRFKNNFKHIFSKIEESIDVLTKVYDRIQDMEDSIRAGQFISSISKAAETDLGELNDSRAKFKQNILLEQINRLKAVIKQIYFPFGSLFFRGDNDWVNSKLSTIYNEETEYSINSLANDIYDMIWEYKSSIYVDIDSALNIKKSQEFYLWSQDDPEDSTKINELLSGGKINFISDIDAWSYSCLKFKNINLKFVHRDSNQQDELDKSLNDFEIWVTHKGNSYYKLNGNVYLIQTTQLPLSWTFDGSTKSSSLIKLEESDPILSPYCSWMIQLENGDFEKLNEFKDKVDIKLVGDSSFIKEDRLTIKDNLNMNIHYKNNRVEHAI